MLSPAGIAVVGPTAVGKSDLALALAQVLDGEVVNADSMQLYRGMDIGTAKLSHAERRGVPHHLLDVLDVREDANVAAYQESALEAVAAIRARGRVPILVGGSGLYVAAVVSGLDFPGTDPVVRARLEAELEAVGPGELHRRLADLDPASAAAILPSNGRKLVRALEVVEVTGGPFRAALPDLAGPGPVAGGWVRVGVTAPRPELAQRIQTRVDRMWERGLVEEVRTLVEQGLRQGRTAARALGYAQVLRHLDGQSTAEQAREATVAATRRFVRRQESWFSRDPSIQWLPHDATDLREHARALWLARSAAGRP
jgi:tRNA dimethylallyltransferase